MAYQEVIDMEKLVCCNPACMKQIDMWALPQETGTYFCSPACNEAFHKVEIEAKGLEQAKEAPDADAK